MTKLDGPRLAPLSQKDPKQLVIMLHGYGADGDDLIDIGKFWQPALPDAAFASLNGPEYCELSPFGRQWFSLEQYDPDLLRRDPGKLEEAFEKLVPGVRKAQLIIEEFVNDELSRLSLGWQDVVLVGFSQGTMVSLFTGLRQKEPPAGILGYSGALLGAEVLGKEVTCRPQIALIHGEEDDVLPYPALQLAECGLTEAGIEVSTFSRPGLGHSIDMEGINIGSEFLASLFQPHSPST